MQTSHIQKKPAREDWHRADIKCALEKAGWSIRRLTFQHGLASGALNHAFRRPYPNAEHIIASAIELHPQDIWPSRYNAKGEPFRGRPVENTTRAAARNVHERGAR